MKVKELVEILNKQDQESDIFTNECEATSSHEQITNGIEAGKLPNGTVFIGSYGYIVEEANNAVGK